MSGERPVLPFDEFLDLEFAIANEPKGDRLDAARRPGARQFTPQHRRKVEANEIVERTAGQIGIDEGIVDHARVFHSLEDGALGDRVEHNPLDRLVLEYLFAPQDFQDVPGNRFSLAIRVGCQDYLVSVLDCLGDLGKALGSLSIDFPTHGEIVIRIDRAILGRQIPDMAERREHFVVATEIFVDRLGLGRRFDDDDVHSDEPLSATHPCQFFAQNMHFAGHARPSARLGLGVLVGREHGGRPVKCQIGVPGRPVRRPGKPVLFLA